MLAVKGLGQRFYPGYGGGIECIRLVACCTEYGLAASRRGQQSTSGVGRRHACGENGVWNFLVMQAQNIHFPSLLGIRFTDPTGSWLGGVAACRGMAGFAA